MLSQENKAMLTESQLAIVYSEAARAARTLGKQLITGERNPDPMREREAPSPASGVRIRLLGRPAPPPFFAYDEQDVKDHNAFVSSLGREGKRCA